MQQCCLKLIILLAVQENISRIQLTKPYMTFFFLFKLINNNNNESNYFSLICLTLCVCVIQSYISTCFIAISCQYLFLLQASPVTTCAIQYFFLIFIETLLFYSIYFFIKNHNKFEFIDIYKLTFPLVPRVMSQKQVS